MKGSSRFDVFLQKVGKMLAFSNNMKQRSIIYQQFGQLNVMLASNEDIFVFKSMTSREGDISDCILLMNQELKWVQIYDEIASQSTGNDKWFFWTYEKICNIENTQNLAIPIKGKVFNLVKKYWKQRPRDFMDDINQIEKHIPDQKLLKDIRK